MVNGQGPIEIVGCQWDINPDLSHEYVGEHGSPVDASWILFTQGNDPGNLFTIEGGPAKELMGQALSETGQVLSPVIFPHLAGIIANILMGNQGQ